MHAAHLLTLGIASALLAACQPDSSAAPIRPAASATPPAEQPGSAGAQATLSASDSNDRMNSFEALVPAGHRLVGTARGPLTGAGTQGAVLVVEPGGASSPQLGEGAPREVLLVEQDERGAPRIVARNNRIVPCATCGGLAGDPFGYARVDTGRFTIAVGGGSRERWSADYTFTYEVGARRFVLESVTRGVADTLTDAHKESTVDAQDLGVIEFEGFDPAQLGDVPSLATAK